MSLATLLFRLSLLSTPAASPAQMRLWGGGEGGGGGDEVVR